MAIEAFTSWGTNNQSDMVPMPTNGIRVVLEPAVPAGKQFVVEHISGWVALRDGDRVDLIQALGHMQQVHLPVHFVSSAMNFGHQLGMARHHQFGSPVRLYLSAGDRIEVFVLAKVAGILSAAAVGYLVDA
jgi:hypothetical protein